MVYGKWKNCSSQALSKRAIFARRNPTLSMIIAEIAIDPVTSHANLENKRFLAVFFYTNVRLMSTRCQSVDYLTDAGRKSPLTSTVLSRNNKNTFYRTRYRLKNLQVKPSEISGNTLIINLLWPSKSSNFAAFPNLRASQWACQKRQTKPQPSEPSQQSVSSVHEDSGPQETSRYAFVKEIKFVICTNICPIPSLKHTLLAIINMGASSNIIGEDLPTQALKTRVAQVSSVAGIHDVMIKEDGLSAP